ncbi:MAG: hypothetical protein HYX52_08780 [Chloroflexi bacterium]|nr:hypothetical protein [Chloroflexota bacterium]
MNRIECIEAFVRQRRGALVIVSPGFSGHELFSVEHDDATLYNMDMGISAPMCLGLALAVGPAQPVVALEGDGSMLMSLGTFATMARYAPPNFGIVVFDNRSYLTTGRGVVASATAHGTDLAAMARGAGVAHAATVEDVAAFEDAVTQGIGGGGPWVVVARVDTADRGDPRARGAFATDLVEQTMLFGRALRERGLVPAPSR